LAKEVGEDDKEVIDGFLKFAYDNNMPQAYTDSMISYFYDKRDADMKTMDEGDQAAAEIAEDALRNEWGNDYRGFMNRVTALLDTAPEEIKELFLDARMKGGTRLKDSPEAMKFMLDMAITLNPVTTIVPAGGDQMGSIQDELDTIKKFMRTNRKEYNKDQKMQERYRELDAEVVKAEAKA